MGNMNHFAQVDAGAFITALTSYGFPGFVCCWFMWYGQKLMKEHRDSWKETNAEIKILSHRMDGMTRAMLVDALSRESTGPATYKVAQDMLSKINVRDEK